MSPNASSSEGPVKKKRRTVQKVVRAACLECRRRKLACDARRPQCGRCIRSKAECRYDTDNHEETHTMALKREVESLRATLDRIAGSFAALKELPEGASAKLLLDVAASTNPIAELIDMGRRIQSQRDVLNVRISELEAAKAVFPSPRSGLEFELNMLHPQAYPVFSRMQRPQHLSSLASLSSIPVAGALSPYGRAASLHAGDIPQQRLNIKFWTNVPISNDLAVKAIYVYLVTDHALQAHFDPELFLGDLIACREGRFCSRLLVNALLFYCCMKLTAFEKHAASLSEAFQVESEKIWQADKTACATSLSALCFLLASSLHTGRFIQGAAYLHEAVTMGHVLGVWSPDNEKRNIESVDDESLESRALAFAAWGTYAHNVFWAFRWWDRLPPNPPRFAVPKMLRMPLTASASFGITEEEARKSHRILIALCNVLPVVRDAVVTFHGNIRSGTPFSMSFAESIYKRLLDCNDKDTKDLIDDMDAPGYITIIRMWYHMTVMDLFQPFVQRNQVLQGFSASDSSPLGVYLASLRHLQHLVLIFRYNSPLAMATPLWHGCIFFVAKAVTVINRQQESRNVFRLCVVMYADLLVSFPGLMDVFRAMLLMGLHAGFVTSEESAGLVTRIQKRRDSQQAIKAEDLDALAELTLEDMYEEAAHPQVKAPDEEVSSPGGTRSPSQAVVVEALSLAVQSANIDASDRATVEVDPNTLKRLDECD